MGLSFAVRPADLDETPEPGEEPEPYVLRLARAKARAVAAPGELVLAADTVVVLDGELLGKPSGEEAAVEVLTRLAGREHRVATGVALFEAASGRESAEVVLSDVRMAAMSAEEVRWYAATGEPLDKAGSYAIQGCGSLFVEAVNGNYTNVVGLPVPAVYRQFRQLGYDLRRFMAAPR